MDIAPSSWTTVAAAGHPGDQGRGDRDLLGAPGESEDVVRGQPAHQQGGGGAPDASEGGGPAGCADIDTVSGDHRLGEAEALLELAFLVGVQVVLQGRRHDDLDAHQPLGLGPGDQPARRRPGDAESAAISACVRPSR